MQCHSSWPAVQQRPASVRALRPHHSLTDPRCAPPPSPCPTPAAATPPHSPHCNPTARSSCHRHTPAVPAAAPVAAASHQRQPQPPLRSPRPVPVPRCCCCSSSCCCSCCSCTRLDLRPRLRRGPPCPLQRSPPSQGSAPLPPPSRCTGDLRLCQCCPCPWPCCCTSMVPARVAHLPMPPAAQTANRRNRLFPQRPAPCWPPAVHLTSAYVPGARPQAASLHLGTRSSREAHSAALGRSTAAGAPASKSSSPRWP